MRALLTRLTDRLIRSGRAGEDGRLAELEERLRVQQASLEELFRSAPEGIAVVDEDDVVMRVNEEFSRMFGYSAEETLGRQINELIVPDELKEEGDRMTRAVVEGERTTIETVRCRKDGTLIHVSLLATPIHDGNGSIGAYGIYRDITERKRHEHALRESEGRYRALFEQSPVGVFTCDRDSCITQCNDRLPRILDVPAEEIVGLSLDALQASMILPGLPVAEVDGEPVSYHGPYQPVRGGPTRWLSVRFAPLRGADGEPIGGIGVVEDVTARERAEQRLRDQAAELERVNAELRERTLELESAIQTRSRLYSAINHELRTPISAISLYHELLLSDALGALSPSHREALEQSQTATFHLLDLVGDVLDLSRLEAGRISVSPAAISLPELLGEIRATAAPLVYRHGTELVLELEPCCGTVVTDPQRLRQILLNLISNAAKFGRGRPVRVCCRCDDENVAIEIVDEGIGIAPENLETVFEDFVQVGDGSHGGGAGLGLAICRRLATLLGAHLHVESELNVGSTFRVVLPREASTPADARMQTAGG